MRIGGFDLENFGIRAASLTLALAIAASGVPAFAQELTMQDGRVVQSEDTIAADESIVAADEDILAVEDTAEEYPEVPVELVNDEKQISDLVADNWNDDYFGEITVSTEDNTAQKDGREISLAKELELTPEQEEEILQSPEEAEQYIDEETALDAAVDEEGLVHITDPYQTCRLIVYADQLDTAYGAERVLYDEEAGKYTLQFATREETEAADLGLTEVLGEENCMPDTVRTRAMLGLDKADSRVKKTSYESVSWGTQYMGMDQLKSQYSASNLNASPVTVAVVDTGVNKNHDLFKGRKVTGHSFIGKYADSRNYNTSKFADYDGHGSHCAGIIADGTPTNVSIMGLRVFGLDRYDPLTEVTTTDSIIIEALEYAYKHGADVVNFSIGSTYDSSNPDRVFNHVLKRLHDGGCVVVAAAGNITEDNMFRRVNYPAVLSTTITVSAMKQDGTGAKIDNRYSCYGPTVDFAAPGSKIFSASHESNNGYISMDGTSMAAPHVSAAAAYVKMFHPGASFATVKKILKQNSEDLGKAGKDNHYGYGAVRMADYFAKEQANGNLWMAKIGTQYAKMEYTGKPCVNPITVTMGQTALRKDIDYTVTYSSNTDIGTATATIRGKGSYQGTLKCTYKIIPETVTLTKVSNPKGKKLRVYWNIVRRGGGYQVRCAKNSDFSGAQTATVAGRKTSRYTAVELTPDQTYFVSVRAYKTVKGKKVWGRWSEPMQMTISK